MYGITYNNKHSFNDLGLTVLNTRAIETPSKIKITEAVPFMNRSYDFSSLYGSNCYTERQLEYEFLIKANNSTELEYQRIKVENWLLSSNTKTPLIDDNIISYYYNAECIGVELEDMNNIGKLKATFIAYPFRISTECEGNNLWDSFNFELDVLQDTKFTVSGVSNVSIYNSSVIDIEPEIIASSQFEITLDNKKYVVEAGTSKDYRFKLRKGNNDITLKGNGTIEFKFRKEVL
jgi:phage-related protein